MSNSNSGTRQMFALTVESTVWLAKKPELYPGNLTKLTPWRCECENAYARSTMRLLSSTAVSKPKQLSKMGISLLIPFRSTQMAIGSFLALISLYKASQAFIVLLAPIKYTWLTFLSINESIILLMWNSDSLNPKKHPPKWWIVSTTLKFRSMNSLF